MPTPPPKCKACGKPHWGACTNSLEARERQARLTAPAKPDTRLAHAMALVVSHEQTIAQLRQQIADMTKPKPTSDRKAYMKDYMAKQRAIAKANKGESQ